MFKSGSTTIGNKDWWSCWECPVLHDCELHLNILGSGQSSCERFYQENSQTLVGNGRRRQVVARCNKLWQDLVRDAFKKKVHMEGKVPFWGGGG